MMVDPIESSKIVSKLSGVNFYKLSLRECTNKMYIAS